MGRRLPTGLALALCLAGAAPGRDAAEPLPRPLPAAQAFPWHLSEPAPGRRLIVFRPAPGHYLYRHGFAFRIEPPGGGRAEPVPFALPAGEAKSDRFFGEVEVYYGPTRIELSLPDGLAAGTALRVEYQGCADWGFCYPPRRERIVLPD